MEVKISVIEFKQCSSTLLSPFFLSHTYRTVHSSTKNTIKINFKNTGSLL